MDRRVKRTKSAIFNAVAQLLLEKDAKKITVLELCKRADINKSTFYLHYQNIDECLQNCFDITMNGVIEVAKGINYFQIAENPQPMVRKMLNEVEKNIDYLCKFKNSHICAESLRTVKLKMANAICVRNGFTIEKDYDKIMKIYFCIGGCADTLMEPLPTFDKEKLEKVITRQLEALKN